MNISLSGHFRGILFDVGWTLVYPDPTRDAAIQAVLREQGFYIPPAVWDEGYRAAEAFYLARRWQPETRQNLRAFWFGYYSELLASLSPAIRDGGLVALLMQEVEKAVRWNLYPDTLEVMSELRSRGFGLGAVSNWNQGLPALCQEWGLCRLDEPRSFSRAIIGRALGGAVETRPTC